MYNMYNILTWPVKIKRVNVLFTSCFNIFEHNTGGKRGHVSSPNWLGLSHNRGKSLREEELPNYLWPQIGNRCKLLYKCSPCLEPTLLLMGFETSIWQMLVQSVLCVKRNDKQGGVSELRSNWWSHTSTPCSDATHRKAKAEYFCVRTVSHRVVRQNLPTFSYKCKTAFYLIYLNKYFDTNPQSHRSWRA